MKKVFFIICFVLCMLGSVYAADSYPDNPFNGGNVQTPSVTFEGDFWTAYDVLVGNRFTQEFQNNINAIMNKGYTKYMFFHDSQDMMSFLLLPEETVGVYYYWGDSRNFTPYYSDYSWHVNNRENYLGYNIKLNPNSNVLFCQIMGLYASSMTPYTYNILNTTVYSFGYYGADQIYYYKGGNGSTGAAWYGGNLTPPSLANWNYRTTFNTSAQWGAFASNFTVMCSTTGSLSDTNPIKTNNINGISYTEDLNLKLNIINNEYGEKELAMDFTAFMGGSPANSINAENLVLTVDNDGTEVVFDDLDSYIEHFGTGTDQEVWAYIPLSVLVGSAVESKLVKVSFTESTSSAGGIYTEDHFISTNFWLKHEEYISPVPITPPATIYNDVKTSTQINNIINELNQKGSEYDITTGKFSYYQTVPDFPDWVDMYEFNVIFSRSGSDASLFDTWHRMNGSNYSPLDWATSSFHVTEFYENSSAWAYADVVVITVYSVIVTLDNDGFVTSDYRFEGFLVWQTDRYYDHQSSFTLIDILNAFQKFANQQLENWDWLSDTFNDIQFDLFDALNEMISNDDFVLDWLKTLNVNINKGFDNVISAMSNISFPVSGGFSLDDLSDELQSLFIPQKTWADLGYDEYKESLGVLALPFEFTFDSLDIIKDSSNYSPNFELHVNPLNVDIPDIDGTTKNFEVFQESDITMSPTSLFPASVWNTLQYFNLFTLVVVQALITYNHIFGGEER